MIQYKAISIAGSDSSGGAGIQADLKTFSALGVYGATVISALTAQNTKTVSSLFVVPIEFFEDQLQTTLRDLRPDAIKIGVLFDKSIMRIVNAYLKKYDAPIIVDPVLISGTGSRLIDEKSFPTLKNEIVPLASIITPNRYEAEHLSGIKIKTKEDLKLASQKICDIGPKIVIIKGGHFSPNNKKIVDYYYDKERRESFQISNPKRDIGETHGTGCNFSSAITSFIAKGIEPKDSFIMANAFVQKALQYASKIGDGVLVSNPLKDVYESAEKYDVISELQKSVNHLYDMPNFVKLIPETKTNFVYSTLDPNSIDDIAGVSGRISGDNNHIYYPSVVKFGVSKHVARALLAARNINRKYRSAINIRNTSEIRRICNKMFICSEYDRKCEPINIKNTEGYSIGWGISEAFKFKPGVEIVCHSGDIGKEPMILVFGPTPNAVLKKLKIILKHYKLGTEHYK
ncbi:bifunctional hydroxymethylpyrimidine kinase/phosphomethylpyrimidine kinase [Candidatus Nitrosocosmicus sp. SS]|uniref:bifunctional hydroxymethylpyrimidine kinase/phosphomethylpyrimidine kinase n=1 Tax=Candidatus Nitrosocosmicus agrestis TaxID=2563600 RepID=UPI00122DD058|nr:bifunctional hydroxymethylpyrimidine kinase/phosphomethylpyrimidine kinase [Candidatus Nitrosocosmicus sp. SS]KAA2278706.1 bifunctional hydroxymethylpyrimidine kinase/phosphomethylpyrimidine kinase [Candidatus Nitrosocosmicus sp. SS]KAF0867499.1 bifunctional hydroxymethylpyrimidine kinase/phosphomethylpyrimidine kinase [Candidatus Nitrosocosmicus sp. SS]